MNPRDPSPEVETADLLRDKVRPAGLTFRFTLHQRSPAPLWAQARVATAGFRPDELERTHWKKVWRSIFLD